jgi:hypothetical protein
MAASGSAKRFKRDSQAFARLAAPPTNQAIGVLNMGTQTIAERNRLIKKVLEHRFGRGKVRVKGSRGTAYGWVHVRIEDANRAGHCYSERYSQVMEQLRAAHIQIGTYGYDDPGSDYGCGSMINISFEAPAADQANTKAKAEEAAPRPAKQYYGLGKWC